MYNGNGVLYVWGTGIAYPHIVHLRTKLGSIQRGWSGRISKLTHSVFFCFFFSYQDCLSVCPSVTCMYSEYKQTFCRICCTIYSWYRTEMFGCEKQRDNSQGLSPLDKKCK